MAARYTQCNLGPHMPNTTPHHTLECLTFSSVISARDITFGHLALLVYSSWLLVPLVVCSLMEPPSCHLRLQLNDLTQTAPLMLIIAWKSCVYLKPPFCNSTQPASGLMVAGACHLQGGLPSPTAEMIGEQHM